MSGRWKVHFSAYRGDFKARTDINPVYLKGVLTIENGNTPEEVLKVARGMLEGMLHIADLDPKDLFIFKVERELDSP